MPSSSRALSNLLTAAVLSIAGCATPAMAPPQQPLGNPVFTPTAAPLASVVAPHLVARERSLGIPRERLTDPVLNARDRAYVESLRAEIADRAKSAFAADPRGPDQRFYLTVSSYASAGNPAATSHTFATAWSVSRDLEVTDHSISWLPRELNASLTIDPRPTVAPVVGKNYDLLETLAIASATGRQVGLWGPAEIDAGTFEKTLQRKADLESGAYRYKADDNLYARRGERVSNCERAVTGIVGDHARITTWGHPGSARAVRLLAASGGLLTPLDPTVVRIRD